MRTFGTRVGSRALRPSLLSVLALALALGIMLVGALELWQSHEDARRRGEETVRNLVHVLAEQTERTFQAVDLTLQGVNDVLTMHPDFPDNDPGFRETLKLRLETLPYVRALFVIGPDGFITHDTDYPATPRVSLADRPYFQAHRDDPSQSLRIGQPLRSRSTGSWFVSFTRRLNRSDGSFGGILVAAVEPKYFESFYNGLSVGEGSFISLLLRDGTLLARSPSSEEAIGKSYATASAAFDHLTRSPHGVYWSTSPVDHMERIVGYKVLSSAPALVLVGLAQQSVLQPWRNHAIVVIATVLVLLGLIAALVFVVMRARRRERTEQERLGRVQRLEALGRIAGGIAHDFGNTIRIVQSTCALLKPSVQNNPEANTLISDTERFLKGAKGMTERLLAFARRQDLRPQLTVVDERIEDFAPILRQAAAPRASVELDLASDHASCRLDPVQFEATLLNLVLNARDAMPYGGTVRIATRVVAPLSSGAGLQRPRGPDGPWLQVTVGDSGTGMSAAVLEQAFDPFFTTKGPGQGSGLGLSQVLGFVQQSAGELRAESEEGRGTRIRLLFPAILNEHQPMRDEGAQQAPMSDLTSRCEDPDHSSGNF